MESGATEKREKMLLPCLFVCYCQAWNAFVEMTEEDQQTLIQQSQQEVTRADPADHASDQLVSEFVNVKITEHGGAIEDNSKLDKRQGV